MRRFFLYVPILILFLAKNGFMGVTGYHAEKSNGYKLEKKGLRSVSFRTQEDARKFERSQRERFKRELSKARPAVDSILSAYSKIEKEFVVIEYSDEYPVLITYTDTSESYDSIKSECTIQYAFVDSGRDMIILSISFKRLPNFDLRKKVFQSLRRVFEDKE